MEVSAHEQVDTNHRVTADCHVLERGTIARSFSVNVYRFLRFYNYMTLSPTSEFRFDYALLTEHLRAISNRNLRVTAGAAHFYVNSLLASSLSNAIARAFVEDNLMKEFRISDGEGPFKLLESALCGEEVAIDASNWRFLLKYAVELELDSLIDSILASDQIQLDLDFVCDLSVKAFNGGCEMRRFASILAKHFAECEERIKAFPVALIDMILGTGLCRAPYLSVIDPYVRENPNHRLAKYYPFSLEELRSGKVNLNLLRGRLKKAVAVKKDEESPEVELFTRARPKITLGNGKTDANVYWILRDSADVWDSNEQPENVSIVLDFGLGNSVTLARCAIRLVTRDVEAVTVSVSKDNRSWTVSGRHTRLKEELTKTDIVEFPLERGESRYVKLQFSQNRVVIRHLKLFGQLITNI